jgi:hypothetical protein
VLEGPRASGKTSLGSILSEREMLRSVTDMSDTTVRASAEFSPSGLVEALTLPALIDEVQLVPELTLAVKRRVDREQAVGMFLLTGSSRLGREQLGGSDPLAGRAARVRLWPFTQGELVGRPTNLVGLLLDRPPPAATYGTVTRHELVGRIRRGGLPTIAGIRSPLPDLVRTQLAAEYVEAVVYHEAGRREDRAELIRTFRYLAATTSRMLNVSSVAAELTAKRETIKARISTLERSFLVHELPGHRATENRTLTAHPKIHAVDTALAAWAARVDGDPPDHVYGGLLETFVINELVAQSSWLEQPIAIRHWRDTARRVEVDALLVPDSGPALAVEVKASAEVRPGDLKGLRSCLAMAPGVERGVVFYTGALTLQLDDRIWAVPISALWSEPG